MEETKSSRCDPFSAAAVVEYVTTKQQILKKNIIMIIITVTVILVLHGTTVLHLRLELTCDISV